MFQYVQCDLYYKNISYTAFLKSNALNSHAFCLCHYTALSSKFLRFHGKKNFCRKVYFEPNPIAGLNKFHHSCNSMFSNRHNCSLGHQSSQCIQGVPFYQGQGFLHHNRLHIFYFFIFYSILFLKREFHLSIPLQA